MNGGGRAVEFTSTDDIRAARDAVFALLSDTAALEREAIRRGVAVRQVTPHQVPEVGMGWQAELRFGGRRRLCEITLSGFDAPEGMVFDSRTGGLETRVELELSALSKTMTRVTTHTRLVPRTLAARLLVQSMSLTKARMSRTYAVRMAQFARQIEEKVARRA